MGNLRSTIPSGSGDNLEALVGKRPHKQGRQNALAADALGQLLEGGILKDAAGVGGGLGEDGKGKVAVFNRGVDAWVALL